MNSKNNNNVFIFRHIFLLILLLITAHSHSQKIATTDLDALLHLTYTLTDVKPGDFFSTWDFTSPENVCTSFNGVTCSIINNEYRVTSLFLGTGLSDSPGLAGTIPDSIYNLTELTQLILYPGIVTGYIPQEIGLKCNKLRVFSLTNNRLTGSIPDSLTELQNLHTLDLSHNRLTGPIPLSLQKMKVMVLAYNRLAGKIPEFSSESEVMHLDLSNNMFSGTLPENMPLNVRYLSLSSNGLWGPVESVRSENLVYLDLSMNKFSGAVPVGFFKGSLMSMYLQRNNFSGEILPVSTSAGFEPYGPGSTVDLSHNYFSGEIPDFLDGVETLFLNSNHFTGKVPQSYVENVFAGTTRTLYLQHNYITDFPLENRRETVLPDGVALCLSYNCMVPPAVGLTACPLSSGGPVSRPFRQCSVFQSGNSMG